MKNDADLYAILGVSPHSEDVVIQAAYRALMRRYHPDVNQSAVARQKAIEINAAYAVLNDPAKRNAYDAQRAAGQSRSGTGAPPPRPPHSSEGSTSGAPVPPDVPPSGRKAAAGLIFAGLISFMLIVSIAVRSSTGSTANNTMNVDENLSTTDMSAVDLAPTADMNTVDLNLTVPETSDLSKEPQTAVNYDTIETSAKQVAKLIVTKGVSGARKYSEACHKAVQNSPSWDGADSCAAFDYAAAYIDSGVSTQAGWAKNGYFDFQSTNQTDQYAAVGAAAYLTSDRLTKIRDAAQIAAVDAFRYELSRRNPPARAPDQQQNEVNTMVDDPTANTG